MVANWPWGRQLSLPLEIGRGTGGPLAQGFKKKNLGFTLTCTVLVLNLVCTCTARDKTWNARELWLSSDRHNIEFAVLWQYYPDSTGTENVPFLDYMCFLAHAILRNYNNAHTKQFWGHNNACYIITLIWVTQVWITIGIWVRVKSGLPLTWLRCRGRQIFHVGGKRFSA